ncbi:hypothetical protein H072_308 [Dactylellina haptotyla CBS 200.50]|uniref:FHA domain-containing protein n=1 Tax=Dactylellina haptotyla (strain CBS 200.50) TaxID=1284197 RepID=S8AS29_DACHA|nr:hypothetical protein H072_308 [Dactylellina haptotyla CBS 200.50]
MATPPLTSSPGLAAREQPNAARRYQQQHLDAIPPSSPPPFLSRRASLKRTASASSSIDPDESPSARPAKRRAVRGSLRRTNSISSISQLEPTDENARPGSKFPATPPRILKRTPSLLPAIDFQPSPPRQSRPDGALEPRRFVDEDPLPTTNNTSKQTTYPTPAPTSEMNQPTSPQLDPAHAVRMAYTGSNRSLKRTDSAISELRAPLASVPTVTLPRDSTPVTFGRSANKCSYLLSKSHLVSRIHFKVTYLGLGLRKGVDVHCVGYNGGKIHCRGNMWELHYGDTFWSESGADIMLEIDDARVLLRWPADSLSSPLSPSVRPVILDPETFPYPPEYNVDTEKQRRSFPTEGVDSFGRNSSDPVPKLNKPSPRHGSIDSVALAEPAPLKVSREPWVYGPDSPCPLPRRARVVHPASPNPFASMNSQAATFTLYEDEDDNAPVSEPVVEPVEDDILRESEKPEALNTEVELDDDEEEEEEDNEEEEEYDEEDMENLDAVAHSTTPKKAYKLLHKLDESVKQDPLTPKSKQSITKHLTNQLAFSRLASTPLSNLFKSLPTAVANKVSQEFIQALLNNVGCVGEIKREGKDASGKALECEYYYIADADDDVDRKAIVNSLAKPSLRACRKTHKQYFWKKPKV